MQVVNHIMPQRVLDGWMATTMRMRMSPNDARHVAWALGDFFLHVNDCDISTMFQELFSLRLYRHCHLNKFHILLYLF